LKHFELPRNLHLFDANGLVSLNFFSAFLTAAKKWSYSRFFPTTDNIFSHLKLLGKKKQKVEIIKTFDWFGHNEFFSNRRCHFFIDSFSTECERNHSKISIHSRRTFFHVKKIQYYKPKYSNWICS
jgi:hypothetical protein